jgi:hypothetical protein
LEANISDYDAIVFRYPMASRGLYELVRRFPDKIIFEHNTKEIEELALELKQTRKAIPFSLKPGYFIYLYEAGYLPLIDEKKLAPKIFALARMGIAVTKEIAEYETARCFSYKTKVVSNSVDVASCKLREPGTFNSKELRLFMLLGFPAPWHGVSRLVKSMEAYKGPVDITVDLIGDITPQDKMVIDSSAIKSKLRCINKVPADKLDDELNQYHLGVGSLAMYKAQITEASPLKVREYLARGFPCLIGYNDTDRMQHKELETYIMAVRGDESLINMNEVIQFVSNVYSDPEHHLKVRKLAEKFLDTKVKMQLLLNAVGKN